MTFRATIPSVFTSAELLAQPRDASIPDNRRAALFSDARTPNQKEAMSGSPPTCGGGEEEVSPSPAPAPFYFYFPSFYFCSGSYRRPGFLSFYFPFFISF